MSYAALVERRGLLFALCGSCWALGFGFFALHGFLPEPLPEESRALLSELRAELEGASGGASATALETAPERNTLSVPLPQLRALLLHLDTVGGGGSVQAFTHLLTALFLGVVSVQLFLTTRRRPRRFTIPEEATNDSGEPPTE